MKFIDRLKERVKRRVIDADDDLFTYYRNNPKYAQVISKLDDLVTRREALILQLRKIEVDIDACIVLISITQEKEGLG